jgi:hypothetical protein
VEMSLASGFSGELTRLVRPDIHGQERLLKTLTNGYMYGIVSENGS